MIYLINSHSDLSGMPAAVGIIRTPNDGAIDNIPARLWAADNGIYSGKFDPRRFLGWLDAGRHRIPTCLFVTVPDVYADPEGTKRHYTHFAPLIRRMGYPTAYVCQDRAEHLAFPECDWIFIGGTTEWKMGNGALSCISRAKDIGLGVHVGRVNGLGRYKHFLLAGADSCDGNYWIYEPSRGRKKIPGWLAHQSLFTLPPS